MLKTVLFGFLNGVGFVLAMVAVPVLFVAFSHIALPIFVLGGLAWGGYLIFRRLHSGARITILPPEK